MDGSATIRGGDLEYRSRRRGRAYLCLHCIRNSGVKHVDVKARMEDHILRQHIQFHQVPYYCSLCFFRCLKWDQLVKHVTGYKRHAAMALNSGILDHTPYLVTNPNPYVIGPSDYQQYSAEESTQHFMSVTETAEAARRELPAAVKMCMPEEFSDLCVTSTLVPEYTPTPKVKLIPRSVPLNVSPPMPEFIQHSPLDAYRTDGKWYDADIREEDSRLVAVIRNGKYSDVDRETEKGSETSNVTGADSDMNEGVEDITDQLLNTEANDREEIQKLRGEDSKTEEERVLGIGEKGMLASINKFTESLEL